MMKKHPRPRVIAGRTVKTKTKVLLAGAMSIWIGMHRWNKRRKQKLIALILEKNDNLIDNGMNEEECHAKPGEHNLVTNHRGCSKHSDLQQSMYRQVVNKELRVQAAQ